VWSCILPLGLFVAFSRSIDEGRVDVPYISHFLSYVVMSVALYAFALNIIWRRENGFIRSFCVGGYSFGRLLFASLVGVLAHACIAVSFFLLVAWMMSPFHLGAFDAILVILGCGLTCLMFCCLSMVFFAVELGFRSMQSTFNGVFFVQFLLAYMSAGKGQGWIAYFSPMNWGAVLISLPFGSAGADVADWIVCAEFVLAATMGLASLAYARATPTLMR
jgi:hypothetical protein